MSASEAFESGGSSSAEAFFEDVARDLVVGVVRVLPEDVRVGFELSGPGGGSWQVVRDRDGGRVEPLDAGPHDCMVRCSSADFMAVVHGRLHPRDAFLAGRLRLAGDVGLALRLHGVLEPAA
ncbi:MAG: SCP2 sterol-binding domain-containing protein [Alphaproteobacteria bacterium]|nr:SCP2 sterol-binding domain-containing protein [Alphaproteobacteria bacterium]